MVISWQEFRTVAGEKVDDSVGDAAEMLIAGFTGAVAGRIITGGTSTLELAAFMIPSYLALIIFMIFIRTLLDLSRKE